MARFEIIKKINIPLADWKIVENYRTDQLYNASGNKIDALSDGRKYRLFKQTRDISKGNRFGFILLAIVTLGIILANKYIRRAVCQGNAMRRFGICINPLHGRQAEKIRAFFNTASRDQLYYMKEGNGLALDIPETRINDFNFAGLSSDTIKGMFMRFTHNLNVRLLNRLTLAHFQQVARHIEWDRVTIAPLDVPNIPLANMSKEQLRSLLSNPSVLANPGHLLDSLTDGEYQTVAKQVAWQNIRFSHEDGSEDVNAYNDKIHYQLLDKEQLKALARNPGVLAALSFISAENLLYIIKYLPSDKIPLITRQLHENPTLMQRANDLGAFYF